jgi:Transposase IS66 family
MRQLCKATISSEQVSGYGPRLTGFVGELVGIGGTSHSAVQDLCTSVLGIPLGKGAIQKRVDRVSEVIMPRYTAMGEVARASLVNYIEETAWLTRGDRRWLWVVANPLVAYFQIHPNRSKGLMESMEAGLARFGARVHAELQRLCRVGTERLKVG